VSDGKLDNLKHHPKINRILRRLGIDFEELSAHLMLKKSKHDQLTYTMQRHPVTHIMLSKTLLIRLVGMFSPQMLRHTKLKRVFAGLQESHKER